MLPSFSQNYLRYSDRADFVPCGNLLKRKPWVETTNCENFLLCKFGWASRFSLRNGSMNDFVVRIFFPSRPSKVHLIYASFAAIAARMGRFVCRSWRWAVPMDTRYPVNRDVLAIYNDSGVSVPLPFHRPKEATFPNVVKNDFSKVFQAGSAQCSARRGIPMRAPSLIVPVAPATALRGLAAAINRAYLGIGHLSLHTGSRTRARLALSRLAGSPFVPNPLKIVYSAVI